ncbi:MAG: acyltransferase [Nevskia sp.]
MSPLNPLPALIAILLLLGCGWLLGRIDKHAAAPGRFTSIDGLRGLLAFFVFLHHAAYWYFYPRTGQWGPVDSNLFMHFGESGVMLFFMITAFLFTSKLLEARERPLDWPRLYVSRVMRLVPLYLFAMLLLFTLVAVESGFVRRVPLPELLRDAAIWLGFSIFGQPDLNGVAQTTFLLAGVTWSLPFEWLFYFSLPVIGLLLGRRPPLVWLVFGFAAAAVVASQQNNPLAIRSFAGGAAAAFAARSPRLRMRLAGKAASVFALACIATAVIIRPSAYSLPVFPLMTAAFIAIACGNDLFGLLASKAARSIGDMGYSLYLLHGALLSVTFRYLISLDVARTLSPVQHWAVILACVPVLVALCALSYRWIEVPGMAAGTRIDAWLKRRRLPAAPAG